MSRFCVSDTPLAGLKVVERLRIADARGFLSRMFCAEELATAGWSRPIRQVNHTMTRHVGAVRGMHFQWPPHAETKLVSCLRGEIWDVAVDLRQGSPTYLRWHGERLSADNGRALLIPHGFAHGFQAMGEDSEMLYCHDASYTPASEGAIHALDPRVAIAWPLAITEMSERDRAHPMLTQEFEGIAS